MDFLMSDEIFYDLDVCCQLCFILVIKIQNKVVELVQGEVLRVICMDSGVFNDIFVWC